MVGEKVREGYKKTEVGVIPNDWYLMPLEDKIGIVKSGKRLPKGYSVTKNITNHPYIRVIDMKMGGLITKDIMYVPDEIYSAIKKYRIYKNDIFISVAGTLGLIGRIPECLDGANLTENANRITNITCDVDYLLYWLMGNYIQEKIKSSQTQGAQPKLALYIIRRFPVPVPKYEEQIAIATSLKDIDGLIQSLEKLIDKKKKIEQGTMQQLLTGKKRLPGFSGEWEIKRLGSITTISRGQLITEKDSINGPIPVIAGGKEPSYYHIKANRLGKTITISASGANAGYVGFHNQPIFASDCSTISEGAEYNIEFVYYQLKLLQEKIYSLQTGGAQPHIHPKDLIPLVINYTCKAEQNAITEILLNMDSEIEALQQKLEKYKKIKQGMMQELLTGRIRLI